MITIIPVQAEHIPVLSRIGSLSLVESHGRSAPPQVMQSYVEEKFTETALAEELSDQHHIFHLIYYNGQPAGYSKIIYNSPIEAVPQTNITKMERLYLLREYYGLQLGQQLMDFNIRLSKQHGQQGMWIYVWKENHRALRFYEKVGFVIVGEGYFRLTDEHANPNWQMYLAY
jgi:ribosomal protein S18 acetylase RimI-like enzyme